MSVFQKLRKLSDNNKEDFLTELLAHTLKTDFAFWRLFLLQLPEKYQKQGVPQVETQKVYASRRPDIEINLPEMAIIIENKIDSREGEGQLSDYANILSRKEVPNKLLVYLTAHRDEKTYIFTDKEVDFIQIRWQKIGEMITPESKCGDFASEMKVYLKNEHLMMKKFDYQDLAAINVFFSTAEKINSIIQDDIGSYFVREKRLSKSNTYLPRIGGKEYGFYYNYGREFAIGFGLASWWEDEHPRLFVKIKFMGKTENNRRLSVGLFEALGSKEFGWNWVEPIGANEAERIGLINKVA
ncbi:MAG TPA: PD-(D/E)XK nuclease family protein, partial [Smithellaceae bacterium]|nr:PD-(D/E)XK nuclease family protein [Smithellaceae bacterium]